MSLDLCHSGKMCKQGGRLVYSSKSSEIRFKQFIDRLPEGTEVDFWMEGVTDSGSLPHLAKVHKLIREFARYTGYSFSEMKKMVKDKAGLVITQYKNGRLVLIYKSFGDCSKEELSDAIRTVISMGEAVDFIME